MEAARASGRACVEAARARERAWCGRDAGRVRELIFTARLIEAEEALSVGLVSEVLTDEPALLERAEALAELLSGMAPLTLRATKEAMRRNRAAINVDDADLILSCYMSEDFKTGMEAFLARRAPDWKGR